MTFQFEMAVRIEADSQSDAHAKAIAFTKQVEDSTGHLTFMYTVPLPIKGAREVREFMDGLINRGFNAAETGR